MTGRTELFVRQRLRALSRTLPSAQEGDIGSIHQARVATRRLREALPIVASGTAGRKLRCRVRDLTRALGPVRELDVALLMLEELEAAGDVPQPGIVSLRRIIAEERHRLHGQLARSVDRCNLEKLTKKAIAAAQERDAAPRPAGLRDPRQRAAAQARAARRAERLRVAIENAAGIYLPDRLHKVRIAVKKLRYALEITREFIGSRSLRPPRAAASSSRGATAWIGALKRAQDLLGRMHDLEVLIERIRAVQGSSSVPNLRLSSDMDRLVRRLETECRQLHAHYIAARPRLLAICDAVVPKPRRRRASAA